MIIDGHVHIFSPLIIANVSDRPALAEILHLELAGAQGRTGVPALREESRLADVKACLILPTASAEKVREINRAFRKTADEADFIFTAGTLHPRFSSNEDELLWMRAGGMRAIKLCSFSQGFSLLAPETHDLFTLIEEANRFQNGRFFIILDTLCVAHEYFGTLPEYTTTPALLGEIVTAYPEIDFVAAHMGGLAAPPEEIFRHLPPADNLYLDTSNAAHTLSEADFVRLLKIHGHKRVIFGTDWPWFGYKAEVQLIDKLLNCAGFEPEDKDHVFGGNIARLLGVAT